MVRKILTVVGARPQFIKAATVSRALGKADGMAEVIIHTGQHFDANMSKVFFDELAIPAPTYSLDIHGGGHGAMTGRMLQALEPIMVDERPAMVLVYGDTNSTLAGALVAAKLHIPVVHVEAGLRSFNLRMPEEINRRLTDHISSLLLCPTDSAVKWLALEGITKNVHNVGDVMYDATLFARRQALERSTILTRLGLEAERYALCTIHRAENTDCDDRFERIIRYVEAAAGMPIVFPVHPRTRQLLEKAPPQRTASFRLIEPVGVSDMHRLLAGAALVLTDSGGVQKEAYFHRTPCITLRDETEWVETIACGWNRLWTVERYEPRREINAFGDGHAAEAVVARMARL